MGGTRIIVVQLKQLIKTAIFSVIGLILIVMLIYLFVPKSGGESASATSQKYIPGTYSTAIVLDEGPIQINVTVSEDEIMSVGLDSLTPTQSSLYPLLEPTMESLSAEIIETQSLYVPINPNGSETSKLLLYGISESLSQATI